MNIAIIDPYVSIDYLVKELKKKRITLIAVYYEGNLTIEEKMKLVSQDLFPVYFKMYENNKNEIVQELKKLDVKAVINGSDFDSTSQADWLNKELGIGFGNYETAACMRNNKYITNEIVKLAGLSVIDQILIDRAYLTDSDKEKIKEWGDVFVKPVYASGSFGGGSCSSVEEVETHIKTNFGLKYGLSGTLSEFVAQKKIIGDEYIVDTVSRSGRHIVIGIYKYKKTYFKNFPIYNSCSSIDIKSKIAQTLVAYCLKVLGVTGYVDGICHMEIFMSDGQPLLVEINPRISGVRGFVNMMGRFVFNRTQPEYLALSLQNPSEFNKTIQFPEKNNGTAIIYFIQCFEKRFIKRFKIEMLKTFQSFTGDVAIIKENCLVGNPGSLWDTIAYFILAGGDEEIMVDIEKIQKMERNGAFFE